MPETEGQEEEGRPWGEVKVDVEGVEEDMAELAPCSGEVPPCWEEAWSGLSLSPGPVLVEDLRDPVLRGDQTH